MSNLIKKESEQLGIANKTKKKQKPSVTIVDESSSSDQERDFFAD